MPGNGNVVRFPKRRRHAAAPAGCRSASSCSTSNVISLWPRSEAKRASAKQRAGGIPRSRQPLTVESANARASATADVPPRWSMTEPGVTGEPVSMPATIVRSLRTCQEFASRETTLLAARGAMRVMIDPPEIIGARLRALREACDCKTQTAFAKSIGVEKNTYNPWEKGERPLTFEGALLIKKRYRIPLDFLFFGEAQHEIPAGIWRKLQDAA